MRSQDWFVQLSRSGLAVVPNRSVRDLWAHFDVKALSKRVGEMWSRFEQTNALADLDAAINAMEAVLKALLPEDPERAAMLGNLGDALRVRFEWTGHPADLAASVEACQSAVGVIPADHPYYLPCLSNLGLALTARFESSGDLADLNAAVESLTVVNSIPADDPDWARRASNLSNALLLRFEQTMTRSDIDDAIRLGQAAVDVTPAGHQHRAAYLINLGSALMLRFAAWGALTDLDAAINSHRAAVDASPLGYPDRPKSLSNLGNALRQRFQRTGRRADLETALKVLKAALDSAPDGHPDRPAYLSNLAQAWQARFADTGDPADLDASVRDLRLSVAAFPAGSPEWAKQQASLGNACQLRFDRVGALGDLDAAIEALRAARTALPAGHLELAACHANLGNALWLRFLRVGEDADLDKALEACQTGADAVPAGHPYRAAALSNLGNVLEARYSSGGDQSDLDAAVISHQSAVAAAPAGHPLRPRCLSNLGNVQRLRFGRAGEQADLDAAIDNLEAAAETYPGGHPERAFALFNLGLARQCQLDRHAADANRVAALSAFTQVTHLEVAAPSIRIRAARLGASLAAQSEPGQAADLMETAIRLLPELAPRELERDDQQYALGGFAGLAGDAAALVLADSSADPSRGDRIRRALTVLEAGRTVLLSQALDTRSDLTDLRRQHPELAARFMELREALDRPGHDAALVSPLADEAGTPVAPSHAADGRRQVMRQFTAVLKEIRALDGFTGFGLPPETDDLLAEASEGAIVAFSVSTYRSDALLLRKNRLTALHLPDLSYGLLTERIAEFYEALDVIAAPYLTPRKNQDAECHVSRILEWLWDSAIEPVLHALGYDHQPVSGSSWPRVWWAPGGLLGLLPIHAAGYYGAVPPGHDRRTALDRVISSYTPTVRALRSARRHTPETAGRSLIVAMPTTLGLPDADLPNVPAEVSAVRNLLPAPLVLAERGNIDELIPGAAGIPTKARVLAELPGCSVAHFACHGASDTSDPSKSLLLLHDHDRDPLTVASLAPLDLPRAQLAYLSACHTAFNPVSDLLDEAINMATAFQLAGFLHVIGTLWEIRDDLSVDVAKAFYEALTAEGTLDATQAAHALHNAVRDQRDRFPAAPSRWTPYIHVGS